MFRKIQVYKNQGSQGKFWFWSNIILTTYLCVAYFKAQHIPIYMFIYLYVWVFWNIRQLSSIVYCVSLSNSVTFWPYWLLFPFFIASSFPLRWTAFFTHYLHLFSLPELLTRAGTLSIENLLICWPMRADRPFIRSESCP